jgi:predicted SAM-dependent methyltransferase
METVEVKLDIGSGISKRAGYKTVDNDESVNPDLVWDFEEHCFPYANNTVDEIRAHSVLEHIKPENKVKVLAELYRVLKFGGILDIKVPIAGTPQSFMDLTHFSFWNYQSFWYVIKGHKFHEAFKQRYSKYPVPGFTKVSDKTEGYCYYITLQK